jgi:hypothetical protein
MLFRAFVAAVPAPLAEVDRRVADGGAIVDAWLALRSVLVEFGGRELVRVDERVRVPLGRAGEAGPTP